MYIKVTTCLLMAFMLTACSSADDTQAEVVAELNGQPRTQRSSLTETTTTEREQPLISKTVAYPANYAEEADERGTVVQLTYTTSDYVAQSGGTRKNSASVYLPYGYERDKNRRYNVFYLVHGHYGTASTYLTADNGLLRKVLDHMITDGIIDPMIVVTPTYNYGSPTSSYVAADPYCRALPTELQNDLMPLVENRYRTHTDGTSTEALERSRDHRSIGGFSMGAVTTWYVLELTPRIFRYYLPISGDSWALGSFAGMNRPEDTARHLAKRLTDKGITTNDFYIYAASGTSDSAYGETLYQVEGMNRIGGLFTTANLTFHEKNGARHEYPPTVEYIYNALPFFFPPTQQQTTGINNVKM